MPAKLIYCDLPRPLASVILEGEPVRIGRSPSCQLRVSDFSVADEHCAVHREGGRWVVEALDAATYVNDQELPIAKHPLRHHDIIRCGSLWIQYTLTESDAALSPLLVDDGELAPSAEPSATMAAAELRQQKALTQFLQQENEALVRELAALKSDAAYWAREQKESLLLHQQQAQAQQKEAAESLRKPVEQLASERLTQKRELSHLHSELALAATQSSAHSQLAHEQEATTAQLLTENNALVAEMEQLRAVLHGKDQVIAEAREAPQTLMADLLAVRRQCEEEAAGRKRAEAERDGAQFDLSRRTLALANAAEELRKFRHQIETYERLLAVTYDAGSELAKAIAANSTLTIEVAAARRQHLTLKDQLGTCEKAISFVVTALAVKVHALRAAVSFLGGLPESENAKAVHDALAALLLHLKEESVQLQVLRQLAEPPETAVPAAGLHTAG
jgi:hypothetical protein